MKSLLIILTIALAGCCTVPSKKDQQLILEVPEELMKPPEQLKKL